jgi:hypothetical protein
VERAVPLLLSPEWRAREGATLSDKLQVRSARLTTHH